VVAPELEAYRLLTGDAEDVPGLDVERYGSVLFMQVTQERESLSERFRQYAQWYREVLEIESVYVKRNIRRRSGGASVWPVGAGDDDTGAELIQGKPTPEEIGIREGRLRFLIRPQERHSVGLFLDHRDNRARILEMSEGKTVLNLFAYTCGFSLAAAVGGARSTVSVDLSSKHLEWGKSNFAMNGQTAEGHEFVQLDVFRYLERAAEQGRQFDLIVIDPPSFAHGRRRGQDFSVARDLEVVVGASLGLLSPHGVMMVSTNLRRMSMSAFKERIKEGVRGRRHRIVGTPPLPLDFAIDADHAKTVFIQFDP
jgi:23S rRNA (cytosine1962-C5)-methyltransferase